MAIKGFLEHVSRTGVSGWCVDDASDTPAIVDVTLGSTRLATVRADLPRQDIERSMGRHVSGFRLPLSPTLFRLLPHGVTVQATSNGVKLPQIEGRSFSIENPEQCDARELLNRLDNGYVISPKYGSIFRPLRGSAREDKVFPALDEGNRVFQALFRKQFFICYGTLLGCIREDDFIENDDDIDVCFLAEGVGFDAASSEFGQIVAALRDRGERIEVDSPIQFHWRVSGISLDVFMAWIEDGKIYSYNVGNEFSADRIYPLKPHKFKGHDVLVPQDPEGLLETIYGPNWRKRDPHFQWRPTVEARQKMREVNGRPTDLPVLQAEIRRHWASFYGSSRTTIPSPFAASVAVELPEKCAVVDLGCGNGRDSCFFAQLGHRVLALDVQAEVIAKNQLRAKEQQLEVSFEQVDISQADALSRALSAFLDESPGQSGASPPPVAVYARFLLHAITDAQERELLAALSLGLTPATPCFFEFRTERDADTRKQFGEHYRRYIDPDEFVARATADGGFHCDYAIEGRGMAKFGGEDPVVGRVYLRKTPLLRATSTSPSQEPSAREREQRPLARE